MSAWLSLRQKIARNREEYSPRCHGHETVNPALDFVVDSLDDYTTTWPNGDVSHSKAEIAVQFNAGDASGTFRTLEALNPFLFLINDANSGFNDALKYFFNKSDEERVMVFDGDASKSIPIYNQRAGIPREITNADLVVMFDSFPFTIGFEKHHYKELEIIAKNFHDILREGGSFIVSSRHIVRPEAFTELLDETTEVAFKEMGKKNILSKVKRGKEKVMKEISLPGYVRKFERAGFEVFYKTIPDPLHNVSLESMMLYDPYFVPSILKERGYDVNKIDKDELKKARTCFQDSIYNVLLSKKGSLDEVIPTTITLIKGKSKSEYSAKNFSLTA